VLSLGFPAFAAMQARSAKAPDSQSDRYQVTRQQLNLGDLSVKIFQVKKKNPDAEAPRFCRASVEAWKGDNVFKRIDYSDIDPRGAPFGLFIPEHQPSSKYLLVVKEGDGDPRVLLFGSDGNFVDMAGGFFLVSADHRYLFTQTTPEGGAVSVFDFAKGELILDREEVPNIFSWRAGGLGGGYFFTTALPGDDKPVEETDFAYAVYFHPPAVKRVKMVGADAKSPKVKLDFDPRKFPDCTSVTQ
jgi:hypothetical protein